jgi:hypothetical protein
MFKQSVVEQKEMLKLKKPTKEQMSFFAHIANLSYIEPIKRPAYVRTSIKPPTRMKIIYDADLSDSMNAVLVSPVEGTVYISIRGTDLSHGFKRGLLDLIDDLAIALKLNATTTRMKSAERVILNVKTTYPLYKIILIGHSAGASIAYELGKVHKLTSHSFNAGSGHRSLSDFDPRLKAHSDQHLYHTPEFDVLSKTSEILPGEHWYSKTKKGQSPHSLNNFIMGDSV